LGPCPGKRGSSAGGHAVGGDVGGLVQSNDAALVLVRDHRDVACAIGSRHTNGGVGACGGQSQNSGHVEHAGAVEPGVCEKGGPLLQILTTREDSGWAPRVGANRKRFIRRDHIKRAVDRERNTWDSVRKGPAAIRAARWDVVGACKCESCDYARLVGIFQTVCNISQTVCRKAARPSEVVMAPVFARRPERSISLDCGIRECRGVLHLDDTGAMATRSVKFNKAGLGGDVIAVERSQGEPEGESCSSRSCRGDRHGAAVVRADVVSTCEGLICEDAATDSAEVRVRDAAGQVAVAVRDEASGKSHERVRRGTLKEERVVAIQLGVVSGVRRGDHVAVLPKLVPAPVGDGFVRGGDAVVGDRSGGRGRDHDGDCCRASDGHRAQRAHDGGRPHARALRRSGGDKRHSRRQIVRESDARGGAWPVVVVHDQRIGQVASRGWGEDDRGGRCRAYEPQIDPRIDGDIHRDGVIGRDGIGFIPAHRRRTDEQARKIGGSYDGQRRALPAGQRAEVADGVKVAGALARRGRDRR